MALKALMLRKRIDERRKALTALAAIAAGFEKREAELAESIEEASTEEEQKAVEEAVEQFDKEKAENEAEKSRIEQEIRDLERELTEIEAAQENARSDAPNTIDRKAVPIMETRTRFCDMSMEQRSRIVEREDVKACLARVREAGSSKRAIGGADVLIPEVMLDLIRLETAQASKLLPFVQKRTIKGTARQPIAGEIPQAVWTEMCASINEIDLVFNAVDVDGYKVGAYIAICNAVLKDSDINLAGEIIRALGASIAKALDEAVLYGTGIKQPTGIVTRIAQTAQPGSWESTAPEWTDLHTTNALNLNITSTGAAFFAELIQGLSVASSKGSISGRAFWAMNRKTHLDIMAKALAFDSSAALVSRNENTFPIIGGTIVEIDADYMQDNTIIGGFGDMYLLAEREGISIDRSEHVRFIEDQTVFRSTARYDGKPIRGEAFVIINYNNTAPRTAADFPTDYANMELGVLGVTAAAGTTAGNTVLTVTGTQDSGTTLKYRVGNYKVAAGDAATGYTAMTSGTTQIKADAGKYITVVELDAANRVIAAGWAASAPKA